MIIRQYKKRTICMVCHDILYKFIQLANLSLHYFIYIYIYKFVPISLLCPMVYKYLKSLSIKNIYPANKTNTYNKYKLYNTYLGT